MCLINKNLAQIKIVPTGFGGTNGVRHENEEKSLWANFQAVPESKQKRQKKASAFITIFSERSVSTPVSGKREMGNNNQRPKGRR